MRLVRADVAATEDGRTPLNADDLNLELLERREHTVRIMNFEKVAEERPPTPWRTRLMGTDVGGYSRRQFFAASALGALSLAIPGCATFQPDDEAIIDIHQHL